MKHYRVVYIPPLRSPFLLTSMIFSCLGDVSGYEVQYRRFLFWRPMYDDRGCKVRFSNYADAISFVNELNNKKG